MPTKVYKVPRTCSCGYSTTFPSNWSVHQKRCPLIPNEKDARIADLENDKLQLTSQLAAKDQQLAAKDEQMAAQLAAKDRQIDELIKAAKKPRTVNNSTTNKYVVHQHVNCFGNESVEHITGQEMRKLMADPANAVPQYIKLKHMRAPGGVNRNVRVPNQKRAMYQVVVEGPDGKEWEHQAKGDVLEKLYDEGAIQLEAEADEDTRVGFMFMDHQEKVRDSANGKSGDGGRRYKEQLDKIHCVISQ